MKPKRFPNPDLVKVFCCPMLGAMTYCAEVLLPDSDELGTTLGRFETATEARTACARHEGDALSWLQPIEDMWEAQGKKRWYRVVLPQ